jgi:ubiquinone/menaquinone biosynthesis C-methylase UbiE
MSLHDHWQLDGGAPELYQRYLVPAITSLWAADLLARAVPKKEEAVLDIACGTGAVTRLVAERTAGGRVVGLDFNAGMLGVARSVPNAGVPIEWFKGSALSLPFNDASFDLVLCQLGLQFFPDRPLALREMRRVLKPAGRLALSVYSPIEHTPAAYAFVRALDRHLGPDSSKIKRAEHAFGEPGELDALMVANGFDRVSVATVVQQIVFPSVLDYVRFQLVATPMASLLGGRDEVGRNKTIEEIAVTTESLLDSRMLGDGRLSFPQEAYVATAIRAS